MLAGGGVNLTTTNKTDRLAYRISSRLSEDEFLKLSERAILHRTSTSELVRQIIQEALKAAEGRAVTAGRSRSPLATVSAVSCLQPPQRWCSRFGLESECNTPVSPQSAHIFTPRAPQFLFVLSEPKGFAFMEASGRRLKSNGLCKGLRTTGSGGPHERFCRPGKTNSRAAAAPLSPKPPTEARPHGSRQSR